MSKDLLLVIDMQNVYTEGNQWACTNTLQAAEKIKALFNKKAFSDAAFTRFLASDIPQGVWKEYNKENAEVNSDEYANDMLDCFKEELSEYPLYTKSVYSSLDIPEVRRKAAEADRVVVTGVVAECCVLSTVMALIDAGVYVVYLTDAVAGIDDSTEEAVKLILSGLSPLHVKLETCEEYIEERKEQ